MSSVAAPATARVERRARLGSAQLLVALPLLLVVAGCGSDEQVDVRDTVRSAATTSSTAAESGQAGSERRGSFTATLKAPTHRPKVGKPWRFVVRVETPDGRPLKARIKLQFLFGGRVVGHPDSHVVNGKYRETIPIDGVYRETLTFPRRSTGFPLTFRVVVITSRGRRSLDYSVQARG